MLLAHEGFARDSQTKNAIILVIAVTGWGVNPIQYLEMNSGKASCSQLLFENMDWSSMEQ